MGRELMVDYPSFLEDIRYMDKVLKSLYHAPSWSIEGTCIFALNERIIPPCIDALCIRYPL